MSPTTGILLFLAAAAAVGVTAYAVSQNQAQPATPSQPPQSSPDGNTFSPVSLTSVTLSTSSPQMVSVPRGGAVEIYPPDSTSTLVSYTIPGGQTTAITSPNGPLALNVNGTFTLNILWERSGQMGSNTALTITAT